MKKIYSKLEPDILLHLIHKIADIQSLDTENGLARTNVAPESQFLQMAALHMDKGKTFEPHKHIFKEGSKEIIAQESWVVLKGKVKAYLYDLDDTTMYEEILEVGDTSMTFRGAHTYEALEDDTLVYEYKTGPYKGQTLDKVFLNKK